jgi:pimeloyl-ACP methyl ester carboxylesterase
MPQLAHDVKLFYKEAGAGEPPIVFVHGWCCNNGYFAPQAKAFKKRHRTISVDLRGHGRSGKPKRQEYSPRVFADDVAWMCGELDVQKPVVVGHSMGGLVALQLAASHPDLASGIVLVDPAPIIKNEATIGMFKGMAESLRGAGYLDVVRGFVNSGLFAPGDDEAVKARVVDEISSARQHVMAGCADGMLAFDGEAALRAAKVPGLVIWAGDPPPDFPRMRELMPTLSQAKTFGAGHFHQLLVPDQVNAMIARFVQAVAAA